MTQFSTAVPAASRSQEALRVARELFQQHPDWVTFFREVMGVEGVIRRMFPSDEEFRTFERSDEFKSIQEMVAALRDRPVADEANDPEPTRVITVRLPKSLHESLRSEAHQRQTSMNKLCISKLLQVLQKQEEEIQRQAANAMQPGREPTD